MPDPTHSPEPYQHPTGVRAAVEKASMPAVSALARLPQWVPSLVMIALILVGGFVAGPVGLVLVGLALLALLWLLYLSWPHLTPSMRLMRVAVLALVLAVLATRFIPN
ncbi:DUF6703 family protein [Ornithinicoccus hortensis]|uniref:Uncharacterized protein n=1 Tax=Ornithinicoccus hortensis TaxID=82346 RepID=A0A542YSH3_9MICO|nr:DUF6703 family protein [Ornithinicoccus hortensis]TQL50894.1 hypothetical protein FB467_2014 [Ornithinicoccus hortensis]